MTLACVDIITTEGIGISVWAGHSPEDDPPGDNWLDLVYPQESIPDVNTAIQFARNQLGTFRVQSAG